MAGRLNKKMKKQRNKETKNKQTGKVAINGERLYKKERKKERKKE